MSIPKPILVKNELRKNSLRAPSRIVSRPDNLEGGEETEIAAHVAVPKDGGWGWVVVLASFSCTACLDGICFTFGSLIGDICDEFDVPDSLAALVNSFAVAVYFIAAPLAAAFINRFGFRACVMCGSVLASISLFISYFASNLAYLITFYGIFGGFGFCFINMSTGLIVGYYFEKYRAIAVPIATCGSSVGIMGLSALNTYLVSLAGWRSTTLLHCGIIGLPFFIGMAFQPLLSFTVTKTTEDPTRTITYLPNLSSPNVRGASASKSGAVKAKAAERLFSAVSNYNFPTAAAVVDDEEHTSSAKPSSATAVSKLTLTANIPQGGISQRNLKQMKSFMSKTSVPESMSKIKLTDIQPEDTGCCGKFCKWEKHVPQSRPMYRDDAFYDGNVAKLPVYQKSMMNTTTSKTGLEYQLAVTRAATAVDVKEHRGVFTTAARRILATMMDPNLLRKKSFLCMCLVCFLIYLGMLVPFVFIREVNLESGLNPEVCNLLVSIIAMSNAVGRLSLGLIASKIHPLNVYTFALFMTGVSTSLSSLSRSLYYQYVYCIIFGFFAAGVTSLRSLVIVALYGLDNLTNATGMLLLFHGLGSLIGTPLAGIIKKRYGYDTSFMVAGVFLAIAGLVLIFVKFFYNKEEKKSQEVTRTSET